VNSDCSSIPFIEADEEEKMLEYLSTWIIQNMFILIQHHNLHVFTELALRREIICNDCSFL